MNTLPQDVQEIIKKNLPALAADEMKKFIEQAAVTEQQLEKAVNKANLYETKFNELYQKKSQFDQATEKLNSAIDKEKEIEKREREMVIALKDEQIKQRDFVIGHFYSALGLIANAGISHE